MRLAYYSVVTHPHFTDGQELPCLRGAHLSYPKVLVIIKFQHGCVRRMVTKLTKAYIELFIPGMERDFTSLNCIAHIRIVR